MSDVNEEEFLKNYDMSKYPNIAVTADLAVFTIKNSKLSLLLVKRGGHPEKGKWALPGGFVNIDESIDDAASRELYEETNVTVDNGYLEQLCTIGNPYRDKRGYVVSVSYVALIPRINKFFASDDAEEVHFFSADDVLSDSFDLAFDHKNIVRKGLERIRSKIEYSPIAIKFLEDDVFTLSELRNIYEIVWGVKILSSNFRRKMLSVPNLLIPLHEKKVSDIEGGRSSDLYQYDNAQEIYPPFTRRSLSEK